MYLNLASSVSNELNVYKYLEVIEETIAPFMDEVRVLFDRIGSVFPVDMVTLAFSVFSVILVLRIFHGASSGG